MISLCVGSAYLQLSKRETTTGAHATVVFDSRAAHDRSESVDRARSDFGGFRNAGLAAALLTARLG